MGTFEFETTNTQSDVQGSSRITKNECIVAFKVYDQCRQQDCLTPSIIGPARAAECKRIGDKHISEGEIIVPPSDAAAVTIENLRLVKVIIVDKEPNPFRAGFWDIDLKYVFRYRLVFREANGEVIDSIRANSIFNKKVTLFGSIGTDLVIATDLFCKESETLDADPFVLVEGKAVALAAQLKYPKCVLNVDYDNAPFNGGRPDDNNTGATEVLVTIGLFTIIKLFRLVNLVVESRGFCVPDECDEVSPLNPCEFFDSLDFPFDIFSPPQKEDFVAGTSISNNGRDDRRCKDDKKPCGCK